MNRHDQERLLADVLGDDDAARRREETLAQGLGALRRRRQTQNAAALAILIVPCALMLSHRKPAPAPTHAIPPQSAPPAVEHISKSELLALFPNRPVALIGEPGSQRLIFLDQPTSTPSAPAEGIQ